MSRRALSWLGLAVVLAAVLFVGSRGSGKPPTDAERAHRIAITIRCPTCRSQSAANSDAPAAEAIRDEILRRVQAGQSDREIKAYLVSRYSNDILLDPPRRGVSAVVWVLPVVALAATIAGLAVAFRRWRPKRRQASADDRSIVEQALQQ